MRSQLWERARPPWMAEVQVLQERSPARPAKPGIESRLRRRSYIAIDVHAVGASQGPPLLTSLASTQPLAASNTAFVI